MRTLSIVAGLGTAFGLTLLGGATAPLGAVDAVPYPVHAGIVSPQTGGDLATVRWSKPETLVTLDPKAIKGVPTRLSWSPDGTTLYLRVSQFDRWGSDRPTHLTVAVASNAPIPRAGEPAWAAVFWFGKGAGAPRA
jgi:hypothetical protein